MITFNPRLGFGLDIEHTEDIIHLVGGEEEDDRIPAAFIGLISVNNQRQQFYDMSFKCYICVQLKSN